MISFKSYLTLSSFICILTLVQTQPLFFDLSVPETQWQSPNTEPIVPNLQNFQEQFLQQFQQQIEQHQMLVGNVLQQQQQEQQQQLQERLQQQQQQQQQQQLQQQQELERQQQELQREQQLVQQQQQQQQREQQLQRREQELQQQQQRQQQLREQLQQQQQQLLEQQQQLQQQREQQQQQQQEQILLQQPQQLLQLQQPPKLQLQQPQQLSQQKPQPPSTTNNVETKFWRNTPNGGLIQQRQVTLKTVPNPQILLPQYPPLLQMQALLPKNILQQQQHQQQQQQPTSTLNGETTNWNNTPNGGVLTNHISHYHVFSYRSQTSDATPTISPQTTTTCNSCCDAKNALCSTCCFGVEPALGGPALKAAAG